jgi:hypothetical protein
MKKMLDEDEAYYLGQYARDLQPTNDQPSLCAAFALNTMGQCCNHNNKDKPETMIERLDENNFSKGTTIGYNTSCSCCDKTAPTQLLCCRDCNVVSCRDCIVKEAGKKLNVLSESCPAKFRNNYVTLSDVTSLAKRTKNTNNKNTKKKTAAQVKQNLINGTSNMNWWVCSRPCTPCGWPLNECNEEEDGGGGGEQSEEQKVADGNCEEDENKTTHDEPTHVGTCKTSRILQMFERVYTRLEKEAQGNNDKATILKNIEQKRQKMFQCRKRLTIYRSHLVSDYHQSKWRDTVLDELKARGQGIYCIHDYWQKYLPQKHKNAQSDAFGARGISVHGKVPTRK